MKKIVASLVVVTLLSATVATRSFADEWGGRHHGAVVAFDPLWPITAALTLPVAIAATVVRATVPPPLVAEPSAPAVTVEPRVYAPPPVYYEPEVYYAPRTYYAPRAYYAPGYYSAPGYYHHRGHRRGW